MIPSGPVTPRQVQGAVARGVFIALLAFAVVGFIIAAAYSMSR